MTKMIRPQAFQQRVLRALLEHESMTAYKVFQTVEKCPSLDQADRALNALYLRGYVTEEWQGAVPLYVLTAKGRKWMKENP